MDAPELDDYILPIIFVKVLSDAYDNEADKLSDN